MLQKILILIFVFFHTLLFSQKNTCGTDLYILNQLKTNPDFQKKLDQKEQETASWIAQNRALPRGVVTIPVVIHVVYKLPSENISDLQIMSQLKVLNDDFRKKNDWALRVPTQYQGLVADIEFEFCLAKRDPQGNKTTGIVRKNTNIENIGELSNTTGRSKVYHTNQGGDDLWDTNSYFNIYVASIGAGILGFAALPGFSPVDEQGVVIDPMYFGTLGTAIDKDHNLGRTLTHETGHFFNLKHIWGFKDDCSDDDDVTDTPKQMKSYYGFPSFPQFSCSNTNMFMNYMDYTDDGCMGLFTIGQKTRMIACLNTTRSGLLVTNSCIGVGTFDPNYKITVAPNPAQESINITLENENEIQLVLTDITGKVHFSQSYNHQKYISIPIIGVNEGLYFLKIVDKDRFYSHKIIIAH